MDVRPPDALSLGVTYDCYVCSSAHTPGNISPVCVLCYEKLKDRLEFAEEQINGIIRKMDKEKLDAEITRSIG